MTQPHVVCTPVVKCLVGDFVRGLGEEVDLRRCQHCCGRGDHGCRGSVSNANVGATANGDDQAVRLNNHIRKDV
jgi:hypothetical protein